MFGFPKMPTSFQPVMFTSGLSLLSFDILPDNLNLCSIRGNGRVFVTVEVSLKGLHSRPWFFHL